MNERYLPICTHCYAVRVEPQRARALRPTCAACGEEITTPPQRTWVGLTDEEIADCAEKMEASDPTDSFWREFFRGIEAKLKEKNCDNRN